MKLVRENMRGQEYHLTIVSDKENLTEIRTGDKKILVEVGIQELNQGWYHWMNGKMIQDAFPFLTPSEREFLLTGITSDEWNAIFDEEER